MQPEFVVPNNISTPAVFAYCDNYFLSSDTSPSKSAFLYCNLCTS